MNNFDDVDKHHLYFLFFQFFSISYNINLFLIYIGSPSFNNLKFDVDANGQTLTS